MINEKYNNEGLDETIRWKTHKQIVKRYPSVSIDDLVIYYDTRDLEYIDENNQELLVEVSILDENGDVDDSAELDTYINLYE